MENKKPHYTRLLLAQASERIRYQLHHHDLMDDLGSAWALIRRQGLRVRRTEISPEFAEQIEAHVRNAGPYDNGEIASHIDWEVRRDR